MLKITEKLNEIKTAKENIKKSLKAKGKEAGEDIREYSSIIDSLEAGVVPTGTLEITKNGEHNVKNYEFANVNVTPLLQEKSVSPTTSEQQVVADNEYDGLRKVVVNAVDSSIDENIKAENIKAGVKILEVEGTAETADEDLIASYMSCIDSSLGANITKLPNGLTEIGAYAFYERTNLVLSELPDTIVVINKYAFYNCQKNALKKLPDGLTKIDSDAFYNNKNLAITEIPEGCLLGSNSLQYSGLKKIQLPISLTRLYERTFRGSNLLEEVVIKGNINNISIQVWQNCSALIKLVMPNITTVPTLQNINSLSGTPIATGTGYIYVPDDLVEGFKVSTNWSTYANQIKPISELEVA